MGGVWDFGRGGVPAAHSSRSLLSMSSHVAYSLHAQTNLSGQRRACTAALS
jgi:hypothetical protein